MSIKGLFIKLGIIIMTFIILYPLLSLCIDFKSLPIWVTLVIGYAYGMTLMSILIALRVCE